MAASPSKPFKISTAIFSAGGTIISLLMAADHQAFVSTLKIPLEILDALIGIAFILSVMSSLVGLISMTLASFRTEGKDRNSEKSIWNLYMAAYLMPWLFILVALLFVTLVPRSQSGGTKSAFDCPRPRAV